METTNNNGQEYYPHMTKGDGDDSYARNSGLQGNFVKNTFHLMRAAINRMKLLPCDGTVGIADLGCGSGPNSIVNVEAIMKWMEERYEEIYGTARIPSFQVYFQDVPTNDFNVLFQYIHKRQSTAQNEHEPRPHSKYFVAGIPGTFYSRLFPPSTLHIAFSSWALHWISKIPAAVLDRNSPSYNGGNISITRSSSATVQAFAEQADQDLRGFLAARAEEMVPGGLLILIFVVRIPRDPSCILEPEYNYEEEIMDELVAEGIVKAEVRDSFNILYYNRSVKECNKSLESFKSIFEVQSQEVLPYPSAALVDDDPRIQAQNVQRLIRSAMSGMMEPHFGQEVMDLYWSRFQQKVYEGHTKHSYATELAKKIGLIFYSLRLK